MIGLAAAGVPYLAGYIHHNVTRLVESYQYHQEHGTWGYLGGIFSFPRLETVLLVLSVLVGLTFGIVIKISISLHRARKKL
jgi:hypothetical protein